MYQFLKPTTLAAIYVELNDALYDGLAGGRERFEQNRVWEALVAAVGAEEAITMTTVASEEL